MMEKIKIILIGFALAAAALVAGIYTAQQRSNPPQQSLSSADAGSIAKLFASTLNDANEKPQAFAQWRGKTLVINFWATWCPPCREEMPAFSRLQTKYAAKNVQFVGIALDSQQSVQEFSRQFPASYPLLIGGAQGTDLARQLGNSRLALPYTMIISPDGEARFTRLGGVAEQELDALLQQTTTP